MTFQLQKQSTQEDFSASDQSRNVWQLEFFHKLIEKKSKGIKITFWQFLLGP